MSRITAMADTQTHTANQRRHLPMKLTDPNVMGIFTMNQEGDLNEPLQLSTGQSTERFNG